MNIRIVNLKKQYHDKVILDDLSLTISSGEMVGLVGPNGVGKTTLIRTIFNLDTDYRGDVYFGDLSNRDERVFRNVSLMHENRILYPQLSAYDHLKFLAEVHKKSESRIEEVADQVGIESYLHQKTGTFSLGMKQHLLIGMAILNEPKCLVLDEPFNGLDPTSIVAFKELLKKMNALGVTILLSSHLLSLVQDLTSQVYFLKEGKLEMQKIHQGERQGYTLYLSHPELLQPFLAEQNYRYEWMDGGVHFVGDLTKVINHLTQEGLEIEDLQVDRISLEQVYKEYYSVGVGDGISIE